ncbi:MAG TPA: Mu transposase C-terminal domain-containing protein [Terriglobia bacterium]|nr:Mu transposase C-terminal domain-containing protein [Terriglobia bacterium]
MTAWLTIREVERFEKVSRQEVYNRLEPGDLNPLISKPRDDGKPGKLILARSMTPAAQERWRLDILQRASEEAAPPALAGQCGLFEATEVDRKIGALSVAGSERDLVFRRFRIIEPLFNHEWKARGYTSKRAFREALAKANQTSTRKIERWEERWRRRENPIDLLDIPPGPERGSVTILDADMRAHLIDCYRIKKLKPGQCYTSLVRYLERKQLSAGCNVHHHYVIPSRPTVSRYLKSLSPIDHAARQGPDALKAALPHIKRTYRDIHSLDRVETDECRCNFFCYKTDQKSVRKRFWLLTFYDERSMFPLVWKLVEGDKYEKRHGIKEEDEIELLERLVREFGVPRALVSDRGRFRGGTFGGNDRFKEADGILDRFGITHDMPREKNPRGSRLERFHRFLADQSRTIPGWIGANTTEREMAPGDAQVELHDQWIAGKLPQTPLLSTEKALLKINEWMEQWRAHESQGTDMDGFSPRAVFEHNIAVGGLRKASEEEIDRNTAEHRELTVREGGFVQFHRTWYDNPQLVNYQGECLEVTRSRHDHEKICVLVSDKPRLIIVAARTRLTGAKNKAQLAAEMEWRTRMRKRIGATVEPMDYDPGSELSPIQPEVPKAAPPAAENEISSMEWQMEGNHHQRHVEAWDFADLET